MDVSIHGSEMTCLHSMMMFTPRNNLVLQITTLHVIYSVLQRLEYQ